MRVQDGRTPLDLARAFQVPKTTMTHILGGLERAGLVEIRPNPEDGRSKRVWISAAGRDFREEAIASLAPDVARLAALVPEETMMAVLPGLEVLRRALDTDRNRPERA